MKRNLLCLAAVLCVFFGLAMPAHAQDNGYAIAAYDIQATLHENNTITQTETISVIYSEPRHGFFRSLPKMVSVWKEVDGESVLNTYRVKIKDVSVEGAPFETSTEDGYFTLQIGDPDRTVTGQVDYRVSFTYDIGDDRIDTYDELYYSLLGPDWDTTIDNFTFSLNLDKPLPADSVNGINVHSGPFDESGNNAGIEYTVSDTVIAGYAPYTLQPQEAVTVFTRLPEGYFTGERTISLLSAWIALAALVALALYTLLRALTTHQRSPVQTVEFYPPEGMTSAEVGYIVDGVADDKDLISLVVWLADKGCLTIEETDEKKKAVTLHKAGALPADVPPHVESFFAALFPVGTTARNLGCTDEAFYNAFTAAKTSLGTYFDAPERALYDSASRTRSFLLPLGCVLLWGIGAFFAACRVDFFPIIFILIAAVALLICAFLVGSKTDEKFFRSGGSRAAGMIFPVLLVTAAVFCAIVTEGTSLLPPMVLAGTALLTGVCCLLSGRLIEMTAYRLEMSGKLLGLRSFIEKAELPRLKMLLAENPAYFYSVLPYAYVFGLSDKWVKQFETLALEPPVWYYGSNLYGYLWFDHSMRSHLEAAHEAVLVTESKNSGSGGSSSSVSSGFSGGGFGGGGGGSW